ncbi:MAG TPA: hypothetical protein VLH18_05855 [Candidatus Limnocylindrales bacterium]|nr:hypothetical protein [Candidatus Limnocylindrales bacterium]
MERVTVVAQKGTRCPKEGNPHQYIYDNKPEPVALTPYYKHMLADGSIVPVQPKQKKEKPEAKE